MPTVLHDLAARGVTLAIDDAGRILARPKDRLDEHARRLIAANRTALAVTLANRRTLAALLAWLCDAAPDGYFLAGCDADFWAALAADVDARADAEEPAAFARRLARWRAGAAERFGAWA